MRLRAKPWAADWLAAHSTLVFNQEDATEQKGHWQANFEREQPIMVEIGSGKGQFIHEMALAHPDINFIGLEIQEAAIAIAARQAFEASGELPNLLFIYGDGTGVETYFEPGEVTKIYLNHSDPWPKARHEKRRLTYRNFLKSYQEVLPDEGILEFKTDNRGLFDYSLESFEAFGMHWTDDEISFDLHNEIEKLPDNVETEYEQKFAKKGQVEYWIRAHFPKK